LGVDLLVTIPSWISLLTSAENNVGQMRSIKFLRFFRFMKLLRLAKFEHVLHQVIEVINSPYLLLVLRIAKLMVALIVFNHIVACVWFMLGDQDPTGWVHQNDVGSTTILYRYLTSIHWSLTQFQGTSEIVPVSVWERAYAVIYLITALIIFASFVSSLTNLMRQLQDLQNDRTAQQRVFRTYLTENQISSGLSVRVRKYIAWMDRQRQRQRYSEDVLLLLPTQLLMELQDEARAPVLERHPFFLVFRQKFIRLARHLSHEALVQVTPVPGEVVFEEGEVCENMYFAVDGQLRYTAAPLGDRLRVNMADTSQRLASMENCTEEGDFAHLPSRRVFPRQWLSEAVLWTIWTHRGDLVGLGDCSLFSLVVDEFIRITRTSPVALVTASIYARRFVAAIDLYKCKKDLTDLINNESLFADPDLRPSSEGGQSKIGRWFHYL